jgi:hypothetical protein
MRHASQARQVRSLFDESPGIDNTGVRVDYQLQDPTFRTGEAVGMGLLHEMTPHCEEINETVRTSLLVHYFGFCFPDCRRFGSREARFGFIKYLVGDYESASNLEDVFWMPRPVGPGDAKRDV